jgi:spore cortex formation protein SpoVR/YcgB (stage V sporulation)
MRVAAIHDERGYRKMRRSFARQYDVAWLDPDIEVVDVDLEGDRRLILHHKIVHDMKQPHVAHQLRAQELRDEALVAVVLPAIAQHAHGIRTPTSSASRISTTGPSAVTTPTRWALP